MQPHVQVQREVRRAEPEFADRRAAGEALAAFVQPGEGEAPLVAALPRGGVPVGAGLARRLAAPLAAVVVRKLPLPSSPEMGFGAVALDGSMHLNEEVLRSFRIPPETVEAVRDEVLQEVRRRARIYTGGEEPPPVAGRHVVLVDDGLATGYTALAAAAMLRRAGAATLALAVPVSPVDSLERVEEHFDAVRCLRAQTAGPFAVASFYRDFHEMTDEEVLALLREANPPAAG